MYQTQFRDLRESTKAKKRQKFELLILLQCLGSQGILKPVFPYFALCRIRSDCKKIFGLAQAVLAPNLGNSTTVNPSSVIYEILLWAGEDGIIWTVVGLLALLFAIGIMSERHRSSAPALMTSLGILGTFCGIFLALYPLDFSPGKMNDSVQALLEGMRTAFITSLFGLAAAIIFRLTASRLSRLITPNETIPIERRQVLDRLDAIKQAISGDGDSSLVTQFQKLRDENRDGFSKLDGLNETIRDALLKNLDTLIQDLREIIGKQLGDSLRDLIKNIEEALIKQFGKTFVEFNEATQAIKRWQEDHRNQVEKLTEAFNLSAEKIKQIADDCDRISRNNGAIA